MEYVGKDVKDNIGLSSNLVSKQENVMIWWNFLLSWISNNILIKYTN